MYKMNDWYYTEDGHLYGPINDRKKRGKNRKALIQKWYGGDEDVYNFFECAALPIPSYARDYAMSISDERFNKCNELHPFNEEQWKHLYNYGFYNVN